MPRDSELQRRITALQSEAEQNDRMGSRAAAARCRRRIAMLVEDERRPTFAKPAEFGRADDYAAWRKEQGL
jgi:hypothetical protein